jgi:DNA topoisomerase VI subunit A
MLTGKGYPDLATRMFWTTLMRNYSQMNNNLHCFILTDADPHGIDIAKVYKYGSQAMEYMNKELCLQEGTEELLLKRVHWIGLNIITDFDLFLLSEKCKIEMDELDKRKIDDLLREFNIITKKSSNGIIPKKMIHSVRYNDYYQWKQQLKFMKKYKLKAEIQALSSRGLLFLSEAYLPAKMNQILKAMHSKCS